MNKSKIVKWFKPNFDIDENSALTNDASLKNKSSGSKNNVHKSSKRFLVSRNLIDKIEPVAVVDLAVHVKKISDVENWLVSNVLSSEKVSVLLLTGPTGSGKTATIRVLCKHKNIEISEWINPQDLDTEEFKGPGQTVKFTEFLIQTSRYQSLFDTSCSRKKIVLVEDFPNTLIHNPAEFEGILMKFLNEGISPAVFICTDSKDFHTNLSQQLFPQSLKDAINMTVISFNPVSPTLLKGALKRVSNIIYENYKNIYKIPSQETIDSIINTCMGDIRYALNSFNFACVKGSKELPISIKETQKPVGTKRKRNNKDKGTLSNMYKNDAVGFLHGVGRVLYPKRIGQDTDDIKFEHTPESVFNEFVPQPKKFVYFLHENYLRYFGNFDDICQASEILSLSEILLSDWKDNDLIAQYGLWIAISGLMVCNQRSENKWNPVKGPRYVKQRYEEKPFEDYVLKTVEKSYFDIITKSGDKTRF